MPLTEIAQFGPHAINIENGKKYAWCNCGQSKKQPFCDGSHKGTEFKPFILLTPQHCEARKNERCVIDLSESTDIFLL